MCKPVLLPVLILSAALPAWSQPWNTDLNTGAHVSYLSPAEKEVIFLVNQARSDPKRFAQEYMESRKDESPSAEECYNELLSADPVGPLAPSKALSLAARDHAQDMGGKGKTGHVSSNGKTATDRVKKYGEFTGRYDGPWENCSYGFDDPLKIVLQLLIDEGVPNRGHRKNIFQKDVNFIGVSIQPHKGYAWNCVMDFADSIRDK